MNCLRLPILLAVLLLIVLSASPVAAQIPRTISYQGVLTDPNGTFIADGNHTLALNLYATASGGAPIYSETQTVAVIKGIFNVIIGSLTPIPVDLAFDRAYFLGVTIDGTTELSPRTPMTAVPYALRASVAEVAQSLAPTATGFIQELQNADGTISLTSPNGPTAIVSVANGGIGTVHLANEAVTSAKIAEETIINADVSPTAAIAYSKLNLNKSIVNTDINSTGATSDQVLTCVGTSVVWANPVATSLVLPDSQSATSGRSLFAVTNTGVGSTAHFQIANAANTSSALKVGTNGIGSGITVQLTNASNGARGIDVLQTGVGPGVFASSAGGNAIWGITSSISAAGVIADNTFGEAVVGRNRGGNGVGAVVGRNDSSGYGVRGFNTKNGIGVFGQAGISGGTGVGGRFENVNASNTQPALQVVTNSSGPSATFTGRVSITGNLSISGTLSKGAGSFKIDHPLDPENKYLYHSFVESPDMMNIYNGNVTLDDSGQAWIELPKWFQALNRDFRYTLTSIGAPGPNLYIAQEVTDNRFKIAGGTAGARVSWQVTGIRHDTYANEHRIPIEEDKSAEEKGHLSNRVESVATPVLSLPSASSSQDQR